jgi:hypothetical protein
MLDCTHVGIRTEKTRGADKKLPDINENCPTLSWVYNRDLTILGRQRDGNGYQHNRSLKIIE